MYPYLMALFCLNGVHRMPIKCELARSEAIKGKVHSRMIFDYLLVFNNSVSMVLFKFLKDKCMSMKLKLFENSWAPPLAAISGPRRLNKNNSKN